MTARRIPGSVLLALALAVSSWAASPTSDPPLQLHLDHPPAIVRPLQPVTLAASGPGTVSVRDGTGREYVRMPATGRVTFTAGGAAGDHELRLLDAAGRTKETDVDTTGGEEQSYFEDCPVCCRPVEIFVRSRPGEVRLDSPWRAIRESAR